MIMEVCSVLVAVGVICGVDNSQEGFEEVEEKIEVSKPPPKKDNAGGGGGAGGAQKKVCDVNGLSLRCCVVCRRIHWRRVMKLVRVSRKGLI
jgi:hypothetical protein